MKRKPDVINFIKLQCLCLYAIALYFSDRYGNFWPADKVEQKLLQMGLISINVRIPEEGWEKFQNMSSRYYDDANNKDKFVGKIEVRFCLAFS